MKRFAEATKSFSPCKVLTPRFALSWQSKVLQNTDVENALVEMKTWKNLFWIENMVLKKVVVFLFFFRVHLLSVWVHCPFLSGKGMIGWPFLSSPADRRSLAASKYKPRKGTQSAKSAAFLRERDYGGAFHCCRVIFLAIHDEILQIVASWLDVPRQKTTDAM